jgi:hypothetical protein
VVVTVPFDTMQVIPAGWSEHHQPVTESAMTATINLETPGTPGGWDPTSGPTDGTVVVVWSGPARVQVLNDIAGQIEAADQSVTSARYLVVIPKAAPLPVLDVTTVHVTAVTGNGDVNLVGKRLTVRSADTGSITWERDLTCDLDETNQEA